MTSELHYLSLLEISGRIRRRDVTSEVVTSSLLARIQRHEPRLHSMFLLLADSALAAARQADAEIAAGLWRGPLHGVPIALKDMLWMRGLPTTAGTELLREFRPTADAEVVARLRRAGAVLIAKLAMTEAATLAHHPTFPRPVNPWSTAHWTGVSSSGSGVATAAGFCFAAIGTDSAGSIRLPSAANNLTGVKPTWGRVSRHGLTPLAETLDHVGPMARSAADAAAVLQAIAGHDPKDPTSRVEAVPDYLSQLHRGVGGLVVGVDWSYATDDVPDEVARAVHGAVETLATLGARIQAVDIPRLQQDLTPLIFAEMRSAHAEYFPARAELYGPMLRQILEAGASVDPTSLVRCYQARDRFAGALNSIFDEVDLILTPTMAQLLPTWEEVEGYAADPAANSRLTRFTLPFNVAGAPTISLPGGFTGNGLPIGVQLVAGLGREADLIRAGCAFQRVTDFHIRRPALD